MKPIQIFLRHCHYSPNVQLQGRDRPQWFNLQKIYVNLLKTIDNNLADLHIVFDAHYGHKPWWLEGTNAHIIKAGTEAESFLQLLDIVKSKNFEPETIIYFLEGDYLHQPNFCQVLIEGFNITSGNPFKHGLDEVNIEFVSLYDHKDKYTNYPVLTSKIFATDTCHWRTVPSTTNTYAVKFGSLMRDFEQHQKFSQNQTSGATADNDKFLHFGMQGKYLITSIPGFSTHCDGHLSPVINWEDISYGL